MKYYYLNLPKDKPNIEFEKNIHISTAIQKTAEDAFTPFEEYLRNAIKNLKRKDDVKANWAKINAKNIGELHLDGWLYEIPMEKNRYQIVADDDFEPDFHDPIICKFKGEKQRINISEQQWENRILELDFREDSFDSVTWGGDSIALKLFPENKEVVGQIIEEDSSRRVVYLKNKSDISRLPEGKKEITGGKLSPFIDGLKYSSGESFDCIEREGLSVTLKSDSDYGKTLVSDNGLRFTIKQPNKSDKDFYWIQLSEIDSNSQSEDDLIFSPLRYFFDDDIDIKDNEGNTYKVADGKEDELKIVLRSEKDNKFSFPNGTELTVKVNTYQLEKQLEAISTLRQMPIGEQAKLIKLFNKRSEARWKNPENYHVDAWEVLRDDSRSGCYEQRKFVEKALNTPDFAILEGPPGSGKTTVILELICQIVKQGKRILLCGSTHVAIDNVLERLKEREYLEKFNILPVRIGDEKRINNDVKEFQIDNIINDTGISQDFLLEAANLVCGTTIGILQNPKFKSRKGSLSKELQYRSDMPIVPEFDYLIIDESSKTTFQEFLVPALYAKKWILAGDCMQLSPFTNRSEIVANISQSGIDTNLQQAIFYIQKLETCINSKHNKYNKFIMPVPAEILKYIGSELKEREAFRNRLVFYGKITNISKLELYAYDIIFIDKNLLNDNYEKLPETHLVLRQDSWQETQHAFQHNAWQKRHGFYLKEKGREIKESTEIAESLNKYFVEKDWAEEVAWRIDREYQLRLVEGKSKASKLSGEIANLLPKSVDSKLVEERINQIAAMAFPSILESLVHGVKGRKTKVESTISEGFSEQDLEKRRETIVYQHRMHPEISRFPRERFYKQEGALKDADELQRDWEYNKYERRCIWVDVDGKTVKNYNDDEVKKLSEHLKQFLDFAKCHPQPEGKKWTLAVLTFYRGQETKLRESLRKVTGKTNAVSDFNIDEINIKLHTVDKFQGHEADIVFLSMVQTTRDGFLDNPNRLNVALTRAKFQLVIFGKYEYFSKKSQSEDLKQLAEQTEKI